MQRNKGKMTCKNALRGLSLTKFVRFKPPFFSHRKTTPAHTGEKRGKNIGEDYYENGKENFVGNDSSSMCSQFYELWN